MSANVIEHRGIVQRVDGGKAIVAMETAGCSSCKQGSQCGIGQLASGRAATLLTLPASAGVKCGDVVGIALPESRVTLSALFGYLFPALSMLLGAWFGVSLEGTDGATALGAMLGFFGALATVRLAIGIFPALMPAPQLIPLIDPSEISQQESQHER